MKREKIEITWVDSNTQYGWQSEDAARRSVEGISHVCITLGYKFAEDEEFLFVVMSQAEPDSIHTLHSIPKVAILKTKKLK